MKFTTLSYNRRIESQGLSVKKFCGLFTEIIHICHLHGKFKATPRNVIYKTIACPSCRPRRGQAKAQTALKNHYAAIQSIGKVKVIDKREDVTSVNQRVTYECIACGTQQKQVLQALKNIKYGCRSCTNHIINAAKNIPEDIVLNRLRTEFPEVSIKGLIPVKGKTLAHAKVCFDCPICETEVIRSRFPFERSGALRFCRMCTTEHVGIAGAHSSFRTRIVRCKDSGKRFSVQGYEFSALKILKAEGIDMSKLKSSKECITINYEFEGKPRRYFPDLQLSSTIIEVKSVHTAGINYNDYNYRRFRMLKAKAKACINQGFKFRLMLLVGPKGKLRELTLPQNWMDLKLKELKPFLKT